MTATDILHSKVVGLTIQIWLTISYVWLAGATPYIYIYIYISTPVTPDTQLSNNHHTMRDICTEENPVHHAYYKHPLHVLGMATCECILSHSTWKPHPPIPYLPEWHPFGTSLKTQHLELMKYYYQGPTI
jgi:hypothetical protein